MTLPQCAPVPACHSVRVAVSYHGHHCASPVSAALSALLRMFSQHVCQPGLPGNPTFGARPHPAAHVPCS
jgi:hypothetical protein